LYTIGNSLYTVGSLIISIGGLVAYVIGDSIIYNRRPYYI